MPLEFDFSPIWLSLKLATLTTVILIGLTTPLAWYLSTAPLRLKSAITAIATLPLVLPPTVLGFYMLMLLGSNGPLGFLDTSLAFSFTGLVIASLVYSLPFALQPILNAFDAISPKLLEAGATLRAKPLDLFFNLVLPLAKPGFITASILTFAHTIGEFGVILMIGGNIPDETRVLSVAIYDHVEAMDYAQANILSLGMLGFSFVVLFSLYYLNSGKQSPLSFHTKTSVNK